MVKGKTSRKVQSLGLFSLPATSASCILAVVYRLRKVLPLGAAAFAALVFLSGYEIAASTGVRENSLSLHADQTSSPLSFVDEALTESAESSRTEILGASLSPGFGERLPQFVAGHGLLVFETCDVHQSHLTHPVNPRAPPTV